NAKDGSESSMGRYLEDNVFVSFEEGQVFLTITVNNDETVTKLQVDGKDAVETVVDGNKRHETFEFDNLLSLLNAYVEYQAPYQGEIFEGNADFIIALDQESVKAAKASDKPGAVKEDPKEDPKEEDPKEEDPMDESEKPKED